MTAGTSERSTTMTRFRTRTAVLAGAAVALAVAAGCSEELQAESDGRDLADAVCDLRNIGDGVSASDAVAEIQSAIDALIEEFGVATADNRSAVSDTLDALAGHAEEGDRVAVQQDLAELRSMAEDIGDDLGQVQEAAWSGFSAGIEECSSD